MEEETKEAESATGGGYGQVVDHSRFHFAAIVESAHDAIISKDLSGIVKSWNDAARRLFGYSQEEMLEQSILKVIPEELRHEEDMILGQLRAGARIDHYETKRRRKDGEIVEVSITVSPIRDGAGRVVGASKIVRDISERKRMERLLVQTEKLAATGRMAASIAHEINNPLEALMNLIYLARQHSFEDGKAYQYLLTAEGELGRLSHIARQMLGYYRDTSSPTEIFLHEAMEVVLAVYRSKLLAANVALRTDFDAGTKVVVSKGEMIQIFSNLIANAVDAMRVGGVLQLTTQRVSGLAGDGIEAIIRDQGTGIQPEHLERIFEPFYTTKGDLGTGIGLWVAKQLVEKRGGTIAISSNTELPSTGTTVTIFLPFILPGSPSITDRII